MAKFKFVVSVCGFFMLAAPFAPLAAQSADDTADETTGETRAETGEPDMAALMGNVSTVADRLQNSVTDLSERIEGSLNSSEEGDKLLTEMLESARALQDNLGRDSDIWTDLNSLLDTWTEKRNAALKESETKPQFAEIAELWKKKVDEAMVLRDEILNQAAESEALVDAIEAQREIVLAYYEVQAADKVLETMRAMSDDLGEMNDNMKGIVDQAGIVVGPDVAQQ